MNTATWASMEADSGGTVPEVGTAEWFNVALAQVRYHYLAGDPVIDHLAGLYQLAARLAPEPIGFSVTEAFFGDIYYAR